MRTFCLELRARKGLLVENERDRHGEAEHRVALRADGEWQDFDIVHDNKGCECDLHGVSVRPDERSRNSGYVRRLEDKIISDQYHR